MRKCPDGNQNAHDVLNIVNLYFTTTDANATHMSSPNPETKWLTNNKQHMSKHLIENNMQNRCGRTTTNKLKRYSGHEYENNDSEISNCWWFTRRCLAGRRRSEGGMCMERIRASLWRGSK